MVVEINGIELHYATAGRGAPLLWLHGFMGAGSDWKYIFSDPPAGYQVIAPDLRGHGASTNPAGTFSFRQAALDVLGLLRHLGMDGIKAIGLSGGGITLLHLATLSPASIASMVVVSAPPYFPERARSLQRQTSEAMFGEAEMALMRSRHRYGDRQIQQLLAQSRAFAASYDDVNFTPPLLGTISADTLIVFGDKDPFYPVSLACDLRRAIPRSHLWVIPDGGHAPVFGDHASQFARTSLAFLDGAWSRT
jgi:pimeloyl-ACP methyl ester carboxylesterase